MSEEDDLDQIEEEKIEKPGVDYDELDVETGFRKCEWQIWQAFAAAILNKPEDERDDEEEWADGYASENSLEKNRVTAVTKLGIYAGARDEFNQRTGEGRAIYSNGDEYEGQYWEGKKNGKGKYSFKSMGKSEVDKLLEGLKNSKPVEESFNDFVLRASTSISVGTMIVQCSLDYGFFPCYNGDYINNMRHGKGVFKNKDGSVYKGEWKNNKHCGEGVYYFLNGDIYSGEWLDGFKNGHGAYTFASNKGQYAGSWEKGLFKEGQWRMPDGTYFEGKFDNKGRPCDANGAIKFPSLNLVQQGNFTKGIWAPTDALIPLVEYSAAADLQPKDTQM